MNIEGITRSLDKVEAEGHKVSNSIITSIDVQVIGHFGNSVSLVLRGPNCLPISGYQNLSNLGYMIKGFIELLDLDEEDGINITELHDISVRLIIENGEKYGSIIGFGHFMKDKFVYTKDFAMLGIKKEPTSVAPEEGQ